MASEYVTFDDLVRFHKEVIAPDLDARFARFEERIDARFDQIDRRFEHINHRLDVHDSRFNAQDDRLDRMTRVLVSIEERLQEGLSQQHDDLVSTRRDMLNHFDRLYAKLHNMAVDLDPLKEGLREVEQRVTVLEKKVR